MAEFSKGEWKLWPTETRNPLAAKAPHFYIGIANKEGEMGAVIAKVIPEEDWSPSIGNARLIVAAVNGCASVNPENPMAVAESIKDMYEALKFFVERNALEYAYLDNAIGTATEVGKSFLAARQALAEADRKE